MAGYVANPPLAAPDLWLVVNCSLTGKEARVELENWLRQLPFPGCKPKTGSHTPETYRESVLQRIWTGFEKMKWCYSEVMLQYYGSENQIKLKGLMRKPQKVRMWPTVVTDVMKVWQINSNRLLQQNTASRAITDGVSRHFEMEPRNIDELLSGSEICFYSTAFPDHRQYRECLLLTDDERNCSREEFLARLCHSNNTCTKSVVTEYLVKNKCYGIICVDKPGGNYVLWQPLTVQEATGVNLKPDLHYLEKAVAARSKDYYDAFPKRDYVSSHTVEKAQCSNMLSVYKTFDFPGKMFDIEKLFWSCKVPW